MSDIADPSQKTIKVDVSFYDDAEKQRLLMYPSGPKMAQIVAAGVTIPTAEFLTYYLFHRKRLGSSGYRDYDRIAMKTSQALANLDGCVDFNHESICTAQGVNRQLIEISDHVGEAIGLAVASRIHGLTHADWQPIPEQRGWNAEKTFDYSIASDGVHFIEVENKGSSVEDNRLQSDAVKAQKKRIVDKKATLSVSHKTTGTAHPLRYGTIAVLDTRRDGTAKCWLVDPPASREAEDPKRHKLLSRFRFLRDCIAFISPRSQLAAALATRFADLDRLQNPFELDGVPLMRGNGKPFDFFPYRRRRQHSSFFNGKTRLADGRAGGVLLKLTSQYLFLLGIREDLVLRACKQELDRITGERFEFGSEDAVANCVLSLQRFKRMRLPTTLLDGRTAAGGYVSFPLKGRMHCSDSGLVFGVLPIPKQPTTSEP